MMGGEGVSQRRCGTCRYFEEGAIAGSGWCRHPQRRDLQHMVLVRKSELACRTGWDEDYWEPRTPERERPHLSLVAGEDTLTTETPVAPLTRQEETVSPARPLATAAQAAQESRQPETPPRRDVDRMEPAPRAANSGTAAVPTEPDVLPAAEVKRPKPAVPATRGEHAHLQRERPRGASYAGEKPRTSKPTGVVATGVHEPPAAVVKGPETTLEAPRHGWHQSGETEPFYLPEGAATARQDGPPGVPGEWDGASEEPPVQITGTGLPSIPQCCRTCRDYRPIGDGSQGWCGNPYAFPERTRVSADDLACYSSLGSWWLPSDDWWLQQADISHHGMPTPNVDEYLRQLQAEQEATRRRRVGS